MGARDSAALLRPIRRPPGATDDVVLRQGLLKLLAIKDSDVRLLTLEQCRDAVDKSLHAGGAFSATIPLVTLYYGGFIDVEEPVGGKLASVTLTGQDAAIPAKSEAHDWLSERVGHRVRLLWQPDPTQRPIAEKHGGLPGDSLSLADTAPLLLATEASMAQLNAWIRDDAGLPDVPDIDPGDLSGDAAARAESFEPLDILRFRPNVVIDGDVPFAEDDWTTVRVGDVEFRTTERCDRCVMTTIDPVTLAGGKEPIRTLARRRRWDGKTWFGVRLAPCSAGVISVGDPVVVDPD